MSRVGLEPTSTVKVNGVTTRDAANYVLPTQIKNCQRSKYLASVTGFEPVLGDSKSPVLTITPHAYLLNEKNPY